MPTVPLITMTAVPLRPSDTSRRNVQRLMVTLFARTRIPTERGRLGGGVFRAEEAETGSAFVATGRNRWVDQAALDQELKHGSIDHLVLPIDQPFLTRLRGYLRRRGNLGKGTR